MGLGGLGGGRPYIASTVTPKPEVARIGKIGTESEGKAQTAKSTGCATEEEEAAEKVVEEEAEPVCCGS